MLSDIKQMLREIAEIWKWLDVFIAGFWIAVRDFAMFLFRLVIFLALCITSPVWVWFYLARRNK